MIGRIVSHYRIVSQLGSGGMGVVYEAADTRLGRHVALKLLPADACCDPQAMQRFLREARIVSTLNHPHICTLHDIGEFEGQQFMVMELLEGDSLRQRLVAGPLRMDEVLDLGVQIADALDAAHAAGVIHRDIKPANLFVTKRGQAKVLDFGVAKLAESGDEQDVARTIAATEKTTAGSAVGTVAYMSPEQARGQEIDARSDLFSFGEVLYEIATGLPAFAGPTPAVIFEGILTKQPTPPSQINVNVPPDLDRIISKALEKDREMRYQSAAEMRADLKRLKRETGVTGVTGAAGVIGAGATGAGATGAGATGVARVTVENPAPVTPMTPAPVSPAPVPPAAPVPPVSPGPRRRLVLIGAPVATIAAVGAFVLWQSQRTPALTERDTVVLADFRNRTGDTMFDGTLNEALAVQLRQSPFLKLLPQPQVEMTLRQMGRSPMDALTPEVAREVCQRTGAKAMLNGTIAAIGNSFLLTLGAEDCVAGTILVEEQARADGKDNVITALGDAISSFREKLGESLASVQRYDQKIAMATTKSLEALKAYSQGMMTRRTKGDADSLPFFRRAVEIDPEFALAQARLGTVLGNVGQNAEAEKAARHAYELRDKVSERERLYIEARYYTTAERNNDKAIEAYRQLLAAYPDDVAAHSNLGRLYRQAGKSREALYHLEEAVKLDPMEPLSHSGLGAAYIDEGRFADARRAYEEVLKLQESASARTSLITIAARTGDRALLDAQAASVKGNRNELELLAALASAAGYLGRLQESAQRWDEAFAGLQQQNRLQQATEGLLSLTINHAALGDAQRARRQIDRLLKAGTVSDEAANEMVVVGVLIGDKSLVATYRDRALKRLAARTRPEDLPKAERTMRAIIAAGEDRFQEAYDLGTSNGTDITQADPVFIAGTAALELRRWDEAIRLLEIAVGFAPRTGLSTLPSIARVALARAYAGAGRVAEARKAYEEVFSQWKDADPDLPLLVAAQQEFKRLSS